MHSVLKILLILLLFGSFHGQAQAERKIDGYLKKVFHDHTIPGFAAVVVRDGEIIYKSGFGKKSLAKNADFTARTVSDIGSLTKSITAMAMMQLVEQNKVSLDTPLVRYLLCRKVARQNYMKV